MFALKRLTARLAVVAAFGALLTAACNTDSTAPSSPMLSAHNEGNFNHGVSSGFTVLAQAAVSCTGGSITGDVGTFQATPPGAVTLVGCPVSGSIHIGDGAAKQAFNGFVAQYDALAPQPGDCNVTNTLPATIAADTTLPPGVYCTVAALTASTVTLTLDAGGNANATWLFLIGTPGVSGTGALTGTDFTVLLAGGAQACNVTWWVSQAATMTRATFVGNILAGAAISMSAGTMIGNTWAGAKADATGVRVGDVTFTEGTTVVGCESRRGHGNDNDNDKDKCNQGVGNGPEGCDPGKSNHGDDDNSNDERGGTRGHPGRQGGDRH